MILSDVSISYFQKQPIRGTQKSISNIFKTPQKPNIDVGFGPKS